MELVLKEAEELVFTYIDQIKRLISPEIWENVLLDCSKNEVFLILLLYRKGQANMTQVAEYINVPLNTATGIVSRMEKKGMVIRERSQEDKRVVTILMTEDGKDFMQKLFRECLRYGQVILDALTAEELQIGVQILEKVLGAMEKAASTEEKPEKKLRKIVIQ